MAAAEGFSPDFIGISLATGVAFGVPGALLASWCGDHYGRIGPLAIGAACTLVALFMLAKGMSGANYLVALILYNFGWNFSLPFQYSVVSAVDNSGLSVAVAPAFHGAGAALDPVIAALYITAENFAAVNWLAAVGVVLSLLLLGAALSMSGGQVPVNLQQNEKKI